MMANDAADFGDLQKVIDGIFALVGVFVIVAVAAWCLKTYQFISAAASGSGTVVALDAGGSHRRIKFVTSAGKEIEYAQNGLIAGYRVGDEATVLYDPQNPRDASINSFGALWGFQILGFVLGAVFTIVGAINLFGWRR